MERPKIGVFSLTGCGGDQLMILNLEDVLLDLLSYFDIKDFQEISSFKEDSDLDIAFVEGSVSTKQDLRKLKEIRARCKMLIAIGNCAISGGIQAMKNGQMEILERMKRVYGIEEDIYGVLEPKGLSAYVKVDLEIPGCPIEKEETLRAITSILHGDMPDQFDYPVCVECKLKEYPCVLIEKNLPCLGPIIVAGCGARCPGLGLPCIGCRGPIKEEANAAAELEVLLSKGYDEEHIINLMRIFCANFEEIKKITEIIRRRSGKGGQE